MIQRLSKLGLLAVLLLATTVAAFASGSHCDPPVEPVMDCHEEVVVHLDCCCDSHEPEETDLCGCIAELPDHPQLLAIASPSVPQIIVAIEISELVEVPTASMVDDGAASALLPNKGPPRPPLLDSRSLRAPPTLMFS